MEFDCFLGGFGIDAYIFLRLDCWTLEGLPLGFWRVVLVDWF